MKIVEINIYGYGKFENVTFTELHGYQVFYGENEAGKSTIMSFIHSILFGFPTRQQSELRYEPKRGAKYGGSLTVIFPEQGMAVIERVKGKASGDVSVRLENGRTGGEDLIKELLSSIDKGVFQAIYSFNLHGLQNIHQMKGEDLGRFLFSTGAVGSDRLVKAENDLNKELDSRFKPNGRNPLLNAKLKELRQVWNELRKAEENNEQYIHLVGKKTAVEQRIKEKQEESSRLSRQLVRFEEWKKAEPLLRQETVLQDELSQLGNAPFPEDGLQQLERIKELQEEIERKRAVLSTQIKSLRIELDEIKPDFKMIEKEQEISTAAESLSVLEQWKLENLQLQVRVKKLNEEMTFLQNKLHHQFSEEDILTSDTSIYMRERSARLMTEQQRLSDKKRELDELFQKEQLRLEQLEKEVHTLQNELMPDAERQKLKEQLSLFGSRDSLLSAYGEVKERLSFLSESLKRAENHRRREQIQNLTFLIFLSFLIIAGWFAELIVMSVVGGIGIILVLFLFMRSRSRQEEPHLQRELQKWERKEDEYKEKLNQPDEQLDFLQQQIKKDEMQREKLLSLTVKLEEQQTRYDRVIDQYEAWEREKAGLKKQLLAAGREINIPERIALNFLFDSFQIMDDLKRNVQEKRHILEQISANENLIQTANKQLQQLLAPFFPADEPFREAVLSLRKKVRIELEKSIKFTEKKQQLDHLDEEYRALDLEWSRLHQELSFLFSGVSAENEEQFRHMARTAVHRNELLVSLERVSMQLKMISLQDEEKAQLLDGVQWEATIQEMEAEKESGVQILNRLHEELAQLNYKIGLLEEGGTYAEVLHRFKLLQSDFQKEARECAVFMTAKEALAKTVQTFKEERMPKMLAVAQEYLSFLTDEHYIRILPRQEGSGFLIESCNGILFEANELSQATTEQIYVSIRLALAMTIYEKYNLPIIIDDSFVNFDAKRTEKTIKLLKQLNGRQILFFTCHEHLLKHFKQEDVIHLKQIRSALPEPGQ
nr:AAA family ATPase [uncultured Bacillus sp.]